MCVVAWLYSACDWQCHMLQQTVTGKCHKPKWFSLNVTAKCHNWLWSYFPPWWKVEIWTVTARVIHLWGKREGEVPGRCRGGAGEVPGLASDEVFGVLWPHYHLYPSLIVRRARDIRRSHLRCHLAGPRHHWQHHGLDHCPDHQRVHRPDHRNGPHR